MINANDKSIPISIRYKLDLWMLCNLCIKPFWNQIDFGCLNMDGNATIAKENS